MKTCDYLSQVDALNQLPQETIAKTYQSKPSRRDDVYNKDIDKYEYQYVTPTEHIIVIKRTKGTINQKDFYYMEQMRSSYVNNQRNADIMKSRIRSLGLAISDKDTSDALLDRFEKFGTYDNYRNNINKVYDKSKTIFLNAKDESTRKSWLDLYQYIISYKFNIPQGDICSFVGSEITNMDFEEKKHTMSKLLRMRVLIIESFPSKDKEIDEINDLIKSRRVNGLHTLVSIVYDEIDSNIMIKGMKPIIEKMQVDKNQILSNDKTVIVII